MLRGLFRFSSSESFTLGKMDIHTINCCSVFKEISSKEKIVIPNPRNREGFLEAPVCIFPHPSHAVPHLCSVQVCGGKFRNL